MNSEQPMNSNRPILIKPPIISSDKINITIHSSIERFLKECFEIVLIESGNATILIEGISYSVSSGDIFIPKNHYVIKAVSPENCSVIIIKLFDFVYSGLNNNEVTFLPNEIIIPYNNTTIPIIRTINEISLEMQEKKDQYKLASEKLAEYLLILLERKFGNWENLTSSASIIEGIRDYIEKNYEKALTLSSLSDIFYISPFHIAHMFKDKYDISPIQYLINTRINVSKDLLAKTDYSIVEISNLVGYPNANYYNVIFKRFEGISPGRYRKKYKKKT